MAERIAKRIAIIPAPKQMKRGEEMLLGKVNEISYRIECDFTSGEVADEAKKFIEAALSECFGEQRLGGSDREYVVSLKLECSEHSSGSEEYRINATANGTCLYAFSEAGLLYAAYTFAELLERRDGCGYIHEAEIYDRPSLKRRGLYQESRFGSEFLTFDRWKQIIDYISRKKLNELTIGVYGCWDIQYGEKLSEYAYLPLQSATRLRSYHDIRYYSVKKGEFVIRNGLTPSLTEDDFFGSIVAYAEKKNVRVRPLVNSLGHNSLIPREYPEVSAVGEDGRRKGFGLCLSDPEALRLMCSIYDEIIDKYLLPNGVTSIHIGMDELSDTFNIDASDITRAVSPRCFCEDCSRNWNDAIENYAVNICRHLKSRGMNDIHIYHDMLFGHGITKLEFADRLKAEGLDDVVVIDWWSYSSGKNFFDGNKENIRSDIRCIVKPMTGYYSWTIPTATNYCVEDAVELAYRRGLEGVESYTSFEYCNDFGYNYLSEITWNADNIKKTDDVYAVYAEKFLEGDAVAHIRNMLELMNDNIKANTMKSVFNYYTYGYVRPGYPIPRHYPGEAFERLKKDEEQMLSYLVDVRERAKAAYEYFSSIQETDAAMIWKLLACHYMTNSNEYIELFTLEREYNSGVITLSDISSRLNKLIDGKEAFMALIEDVRWQETSYTYLREASIMRQYLLDFSSYIEECIREGTSACTKLTEPFFEHSDMFWKMR